jgi:hypothetical protein
MDMLTDETRVCTLFLRKEKKRDIRKERKRADIPILRP